MTPRGRNVTRRTGQYQGQEVEIFEIAAAVTPPFSTFHGEIFVDRTSSLPKTPAVVSRGRTETKSVSFFSVYLGATAVASFDANYVLPDRASKAQRLLYW